MAGHQHRDLRLTERPTSEPTADGLALPGRYRWLRITITVVIALALVLVFSLVIQLRSELRQLQEEPVDSLHWNVNQLELEVVRLEAEVGLALARPDGDLASLRKRFDLFYSRAVTVIEGTMFSRLGLVDTVAPMKKRMRAFLDSTAPLIDGDDAALRAALGDIDAATKTLRQQLREMAIQVIETNARLQDVRRASFAHVLEQFAVATAVLVALLLTLLALVLGLNRRADRRAREVHRITSRLEATVATSLDAVIVAGMDGRIIDYNAAAETIFGYSRAEAVGQSLGDLIVPVRHRASHTSGMDRLRTTGVKHVVDAGRIQVSAIRKSGEEFPVELAIASSAGPDGMIFIAYLRDISDAQKAEAALVAARDEAQAAEQTKTNFIAVMSHEMRTPLNGVIGALDILERGTLAAGQERFLTLARTSAQQLLRHVNDVLDISRVESGHLEVQGDRFDFPALIASLIDPLRSAAAQKGLSLDVEMLGSFPALRGDAFRIGQIVQNFVSNAIKFTDAGGITVEAEVQELSDGKAEVELRVIDTGLGIAEADQERIFQDFVMVDPSHGRSVGGTGLGLAISRRLSRAMGGEVGVESEPGEGSCFWLRLPLALDTPEVAEPPLGRGDGNSAQEGREAQGASDAGVTPIPLEILVVEDNETNRIVLEEMLNHLGHRVALAIDGGEGVEKARAQRFDVILMDLSMPLMDGWTAASVIRMEGASRKSRILAVTAHARPDQNHQLEDAGIDGWLTKPLSIRSLAEALSRGPSGKGSQAAEPDAEGRGEVILDRERLSDLKQVTSPEVLQRLMSTFRAEMEATALAQSAASGSNSMQELSQVYHSAAGAAAVLGAVSLRQCLADLETACLAGDQSAVAFGQQRLQEAWLKTKSALDLMAAS